jgi:Putative sensor
MIFLEEPAVRPVLPERQQRPLRLYLLGRSVRVMLTAMTGVALFCLWVTLVAVSPITIVAGLVLPVTALVRAYANAYRREAARLLGRPVPAGYRPRGRGLIGRVWSIERDPASWRDTSWCLVHAVVGFVTSTFLVTLFGATLLYLCYPFLYWVTPQNVFGEPFGGLFTLHSVHQSLLMMPLALVTFGLWYVLIVPLTRAELAVTRGMLSARS